MALPDAERFSIQDLADRWGKSPDYVEDLVRTFKFPHIIIVDPGEPRGLPRENHYYFDRSKCPEEALTGKAIARGVSALYVKPEDYHEGLQWNRRVTIFVPFSVVEAFEKRYAVQPSALGLSKKDLTGKTNSVRSSDLKIQIVNEMHEYFFVHRKLERVTKPMIIAEIHNRHPKVSQTLANQIASIVKSHDLPGRPPES